MDRTRHPDEGLEEQLRLLERSRLEDGTGTFLDPGSRDGDDRVAGAVAESSPGSSASSPCPDLQERGLGVEGERSSAFAYTYGNGNAVEWPSVSTVTYSGMAWMLTRVVPPMASGLTQGSEIPFGTTDSESGSSPLD